MAELYWEDVHLGQKKCTREQAVTAEAIRAFAAQFDPQPFHLDQAAAEANVFRGQVASGWHTAAITMRLMIEDGMHFAGGSVGLGGEIAWPRPVRPGDRLRVESEHRQQRPRSGSGGQLALFSQSPPAMQLVRVHAVIARHPRHACPRRPRQRYQPPLLLDAPPPPPYLRAVVAHHPASLPAGRLCRQTVTTARLPRIAPYSLFNLALGSDELWKKEHYSVGAKLTLVNLGNRIALHNFLSGFSGTHFVEPRTFDGEITFHF